MGTVVDVLDAGEMTEVCGAGAGLETLLLAQGLLVFENGAEPLGMCQRACFRVRFQRLIALCHSM